jgi:hypothetical protein
MSTRVMHDSNAPTASIELMIRKPLDDYDLVEVEAETPRDVDPMLASQGFKDLIDDARGILERELSGSGLAIVQLTGAICHDSGVHRPGIWLVIEEKNAASKQMSAEARVRVDTAVQAVRSGLGIS